MTNEEYRLKKLSPLRKAIAARMTEATAIPHYRLVVDIEMNDVLALRDEVNKKFPQGRISLNDCVIKACASALMQHLDVNVQLVGEELREYLEANISVVIAIEGGLVTPVIRAANQKSVHEIAEAVKALRTRAAAGQLRMNEILGGSFTISNLGSHGVMQFDAVINPPQCAILAVGSVKPRVRVTYTGETRIATVMRVTLSVDHRAIDGAAAAAFLSTLQLNLERPQGLVGHWD